MGKLYLVGLGPGGADCLTGQARAALEQAEILCGYTLYVDLIAPLYPEKETFTTPMRGELERCRRALELAKTGRVVALVCSGDAGVYGMASPLLELAGDRADVEIEVVPGVTAALSGAAVLGAPLGHDFCVISLSDLMTPWEVIEKRLLYAARGEFALCLYNPASRKRRDCLQKACDILLRELAEDTVCGAVRNIGRRGQRWQVLTLAELRAYPADMFTTVFVGSGRTKKIGGRMVTPRGYRTCGR